MFTITIHCGNHISNMVRKCNLFLVSSSLASAVQFWTFTSSYFLVPRSISTYGRTPWTSDQLVARPLPIEDNTTQKDADKLPCPKRNSNPRSSVRSIKDRASDRAVTGSAPLGFKGLYKPRESVLHICLIIIHPHIM
jgi:hypothetical protein